MKQYPVSKIAVNGEEIACRKCGSGEAVLLIHGNMSSSVHWQTTMEALESEYTVYAPDLRGFGDSSYNNEFSSLKELAEDVACLVKSLDIGRFFVVGWSAGGGVALELAALLPDLTRKVILLNSVPSTGYPMYKKDETGQPILTEPLTAKDEIAADPVQVAPILAAYAAKDKEFMRAVWNSVIYNLKQPPAEDYELYLEAMLKQRCLVDLDYSLVHFNMADEFDKLQYPVTAIHGAKDLVVPCDWARNSYKTVNFVCFEEGGHSLTTDDPAGFFKALKEELQ